jgi:hypothetical protein
MSFKTVGCSLRHVQRACWLDLLCRFNLESRKKIHSLNAHFLYMVQGMHPFAENSHHDDHIVCFLNIIRKWTSFLHTGQMSSIIEGYRNICLDDRHESAILRCICNHVPSPQAWDASPRCTDANIVWTSTRYGNKALTQICILSHDCIHLVHWHAWIGLITNSCRWCAAHGASRNC